MSQIDRVTTDDVLLAQPRTTLLLTCIQVAIAIQILVTAVICKIYGRYQGVGVGYWMRDSELFLTRVIPTTFLNSHLVRSSSTLAKFQLILLTTLH